MKKILFLFLISFPTLIFCDDGSTHKKIVVITPHPDDAESSCGGLIANSVSEGNKVIILTMTGGEFGIWGKSIEESRVIRTEEARNAAQMLGAQSEFFGAIDASLVFDTTNVKKLKEVLLKINPDIVLAPWPLDVHPDHQASGILAWTASQDNRFSFELYFYETSNPPHTKSFQFVPTNYIDITAVFQKKKDAAFQHKSQSPEYWYDMYETIAKVRGYESDVPFAEAYIKAQNSSGLGGRSAAIGKVLRPLEK